MSRPIAELRGLGPKSAKWLAAIGFHTEADLRVIGSLEAWHRLRFVCGNQVTLNVLYAIEAAWRDCEGRAARGCEGAAEGRGHKAFRPKHFPLAKARQKPLGVTLPNSAIRGACRGKTGYDSPSSGPAKVARI